VNPFIPLVIIAVLGLLAVVAGVLRGRTARHEDGDQVFEDWYTERSGPDGGPR
jgi:hypothetical protein